MDTRTEVARRTGSRLLDRSWIVWPGVRRGGNAGPSSGRPCGTCADRSDEWPITECGTSNGRGCAPTEKRVDLQRPTFCNLLRHQSAFPVSQLRSVIQVGKVDGKLFRSRPRLARHRSRRLARHEASRRALAAVAYLDGTITEVALDRHAQADDGSVVLRRGRDRLRQWARCSPRAPGWPAEMDRQR